MRRRLEAHLVFAILGIIATILTASGGTYFTVAAQRNFWPFASPPSPPTPTSNNVVVSSATAAPSMTAPPKNGVIPTSTAMPSAPATRLLTVVPTATLKPQGLPTPTTPPTTEVLSHQLELVDQWGTEGSGEGQFNGPSGVAVDQEGNVYVTEWNNHRVQKFSASGPVSGPVGHRRERRRAVQRTL